MCTIKSDRARIVGTRLNHAMGWRWIGVEFSCNPSGVAHYGPGSPGRHICKSSRDLTPIHLSIIGIAAKGWYKHVAFKSNRHNTSDYISESPRISIGSEGEEEGRRQERKKA